MSFTGNTVTGKSRVAVAA